MRVTVGAVTAVVTIAVCVLLTRTMGLLGLCIGVVAGRLLQTVAYPAIVRKMLAVGGRAALTPLPGLVRPILVMAGLFAVAAFLGERNTTAAWILWVPGVALTTVIAAALAFVLGLPAAARQATAGRIRSAVGRSVSRG